MSLLLRNQIRYVLLLFCSVFVLCTLAVQAKNKADDVLGDWIYTDGDKAVKISIYKKGELFYGKLVWLKEANDEYGKPKVDKFNPDVSLRNRPLLGLEIMRDFEFDGEEEWTNGKIYKTDEGEEYKCKMWFKDERTLIVKGYVGIPMLGKKKEFVRPPEWKPLN